MSTTGGDVLLRLKLVATGFNAELQQVKGSLSGLEHAASGVASTLKGAFAFEIGREFVQTATEIGQKIHEFAMAGAEAAEALDNTAQKLGMTVEDMSRLGFVARQTGVGTDGLVTSLTRLSKNIEEASRGGGKAELAFRALGIEIREEDGRLRGAHEVLLDIADAFQHMEDGTGKTALALMLFGRSGANMIPVLNKGRTGIEELEKESDKLGQTWSGELASSGRQFKETLSQIDQTGTILGATLAKELNPAVRDTIETFKIGEGPAESFRGIAAGIADAFRLVMIGAIAAAHEIEQVGFNLRALYAVAKRVSPFGDREAADRELGALKGERALSEVQYRVKLGKLRPSWLPPALLNIPGPVEPPFGLYTPTTPVPLNQAPDIGSIDEATKGLSERAKAVAAIQQEIAQLNDKALTAGLPPALAAALSAELGVMAEKFKLAGAEGEALKAQWIAAQVNAEVAERDVRIQEEGAAAQKQMTGEIERQTLALMKDQDATASVRLEQELAHGRLKEWVDAMKAAGLETDSFVGKLRQLAASQDAQAAADERAAKALREYQDRLRDAESIRGNIASPRQRYDEEVNRILSAGAVPGGLSTDEQLAAIEKAKREYLDAGGEMNAATKSITDDMSRAFADNLFQGFDKGVEGMADAFIRALERMAAEALATNLLGLLGLGPNGGAGTNLLNSMTSMIGARADGGPVSGSRAYLIGERGPELFVPSVSGRVLSTEELAASTRGAAGPDALVARIHRDDLNMTLREFVEREYARELATRGGR